MLPPAPGLFSMTTGWPSRCESLSATARAERSVEPAGGKGTIMRIVLLGYVACAPASVEANAAAKSAARTNLFIGVPPCVGLCTALLREPDAGQHDGTAGELHRADRLAEQQPREDRGHHRLD